MAQVYRPAAVEGKLDFIFEDENGDIFFFSRDFMRKIAEDLSLRFFCSRKIEKHVKANALNGSSEKRFRKSLVQEIYRDLDNFVVFRYKVSVVNFGLEDGIASFQCFNLIPWAEIIELGKQLRSYKINIKPILKSYVDNSKAFQVAEQVFSELRRKESYISSYAI